MYLIITVGYSRARVLVPVNDSISKNLKYFTYLLNQRQMMIHRDGISRCQTFIKP